MAELQGFARHGDGILLRGWLAGHGENLLDVPGTYRPVKQGSWLI